MEIKKIEDASAANGKKSFEPIRAILIILAFLLIVWGIWFMVSKFRSGLGKDVANSPFNLASSSLPQKKPAEVLPPPDSYYKNFVKIYTVTSAKETYPDKEIIEIRVPQANLSSVDISDWKLVNTKGESATLGRSANLPVGGKVNSTAETNIKGNDILLVSSGHSPVGVSFRTNLCTGYFEQFQDFIPPLAAVCPNVSNTNSFQTLENDCRSFVYTIPPCTTNTKPFPVGTSAGCKSFVSSKASYNGCVAENKNQTKFYKPEWRNYLGRDTEL
jgi:hypothetical protein